jgi:hypothetical protein
MLRDDMGDRDQLDGDDKGVLHGVRGDMVMEGDISRTVGTALLSANDDGLVSMDKGHVIGSDGRFGQLWISKGWVTAIAGEFNDMGLW